MKIAHLVCKFPPYRCGLGNAAYEQVKRLAQSHQLAVFALSNKIKNHGKNFGHKEKFQLIWLKPLIRFGNAGFCPSLLWRLRKFDLIQLHYPFYGVQEIIWLGKILGILKKSKLIIYYHMDARLENFLTKIPALPNEIIKTSLFKRADKIACSTLDYVKYSSIKKIYRDNPNKFIEIPFGAEQELPVASYQLPVAKLKSKLNISPTDKVILTVANLDHAHYFKGIDILISAFKKVFDEIKNAKLIIAGDGALRPDYENQAKNLGISDNVIFTGNVSNGELKNYYGLCDIYVCASINNSEAFGLTLVEAKAFGKPVIGADLPGVRSVVGDGASGLTVKPGDSNELADKIKILLTDDKLREKFGQAGLKQAREKYNWDKHAAKLEQLYGEIG